MKSVSSKSSQIVFFLGMDSFGERLKAAFKFASQAEIARKMGVSEAAVKNYLDGRVPNAEKLLQIRALTNCNLDWLLTGEGQTKREFDLEYSVDHHEDWLNVIDEWYAFEGRENPMPEAMGASFMGGWQSFDRPARIAAIRDFKNFLDLTFKE